MSADHFEAATLEGVDTMKSAFAEAEARVNWNGTEAELGAEAGKDAVVPQKLAAKKGTDDAESETEAAPVTEAEDVQSEADVEPVLEGERSHLDGAPRDRDIGEQGHKCFKAETVYLLDGHHRRDALLLASKQKKHTGDG